MKRKMKWILIENIMGHKYTRWKQKKKNTQMKKKLKSPNNYNILKWELRYLIHVSWQLHVHLALGPPMLRCLHVGGPEARC